MVSQEAMDGVTGGNGRCHRRQWTVSPEAMDGVTGGKVAASHDSRIPTQGEVSSGAGARVLTFQRSRRRIDTAVGEGGRWGRCTAEQVAE